MPSPNGADPGAGVDSGTDSGPGAGRDGGTGTERGRRSAGAWCVRVLAAVLVVLLAGLAIAYAAWPWLTATAASLLAGRLGLDELQLSVARPGLERMAVESLELTAGRLHVTASDGTLRYRLADLVRGHVAEAAFRHLVVEVTPPADESATAAADDSPAGSDAERVDGSAAPESPLDVAALFASVPADRVAVETLEVRVPAVDFRGVGELVASPRRLDVRLDARAPERAERFALELALTAEAELSARIAERGMDGPAVLMVRSNLSGRRLAFTGELTLDGFPLDLAFGLAGLEPGRGTVTGSFSGVLPWPPPDTALQPEAPDRPPEWTAAQAAGRIAVDFRPVAGDWSVTDAAVVWQLERGTFSGGMSGRFRYGGGTVGVDARVEMLDPGGTSGRGRLELVQAWDAASARQSPRLAVSWELSPERLTLDGTFRGSDALWQWLPDEPAPAAGRGVLSGRLALTLPRPFPEELQALDPVGEGTLEGYWHFREWPLRLGALDGSWRVRDRQLSGRLKGDVMHEELTVPAAVELDMLALDGSALAARGSIALGGDLRVPFLAEHDTGTGAGSLTAGTELAVDAPLLAAIADRWHDRFDVRAGQIELEAALFWPAEAGAAGTVDAAFDAVGAHYDEYMLSGLRGRLRLAATETGGWSLAPADLSIATVDTGVMLRDIRSRVGWLGDLVTVDGVSAGLLGGTARVAPFAYALDAGAATFVIDVAGVELGQVLALEGEHLSGTGVLHGTLPVHVRDGAVSVVGGRIQAAPPGGVIRVSPALAGGTGQPGLDFALRALQDFRYRMLEADVAYTGAGDLTLAVRLEGSNPAIESGRPIHYNLTVTENVPTLLRSLRLQDDVTREIERRITD